jgi:hypothetical protein
MDLHPSKIHQGTGKWPQECSDYLVQIVAAHHEHVAVASVHDALSNGGDSKMEAFFRWKLMIHHENHEIIWHRKFQTGPFSNPKKYLGHTAIICVYCIYIFIIVIKYIDHYRTTYSFGCTPK